MHLGGRWKRQNGRRNRESGVKERMLTSEHPVDVAAAPPPASAAAAKSATLPADGIQGAQVVLAVEVCLKSGSNAVEADVRAAVERVLAKRTIWYTDGPIALGPQGEDAFVDAHVESMRVCDTDPEVARHVSVLLFWQISLSLHVYKLNHEEPADEIDDDEDIPSFTEYLLPFGRFEGLWEALLFDAGIKSQLLNYARMAALFSDRNVDPALVSWNRLVLLHGPPGTGKTSLCKALSHKLAIRLSGRFSEAALVEINAHSLFSKWCVIAHPRAFMRDRSIDRLTLTSIR